MQHYLHSSNSRYALFLLLALSCIYAQADTASAGNIVAVTDAWVRPTNPGQEVGAAYMTLSSSQDATLIRIESDVTDSIEIHNMSMQNGVMKMRMLNTLPLAAGKSYKLTPGGFHLMLFDLKKPLILGEQVNFVLYFKSKKKGAFKQNITASVQSQLENSSGANTANDPHLHHH